MPGVKRRISLADQLNAFLKLNHREALDCLVTKPLCWGTGNEIREGIRLAQEKFANGDYEVTLVVASHWTHIPRIWIYCKKLLPAGWKLKLLAVKHRFTVYSQIREIPAFLIEAVRFLFKK